jgi:23S rRNA (cytosine1962-C5)-methyltransferase
VDSAYQQLANRLSRVHRHLRKWARRTGTTCYRLYEKDIPDQPLIVDWYDGSAVVWAFERTRNDTSALEDAWLAQVTDAVCAALQLPAEQVFLKRRFRQKDRQSGDGQYHRLEHRHCTKVVTEQGLRFEVNLSDYVDTGLFLDHRPTRALVRAQAAGLAVLNLFAYTGSFTCAARSGGAATTTTVDLSHTYLEWAGRNLALNGYAAHADHALVRADCLEFLDGLARRTPRYDLVILDPPTFSNSKSMSGSFSVSRDHPTLLTQCHAVLRPGGVLYFSTNCRGFQLASVGVPPFAITDISESSIPEDFRNRRIHRCWRMVRSS